MRWRAGIELIWIQLQCVRKSLAGKYNISRSASFLSSSGLLSGFENVSNYYQKTRETRKFILEEFSMNANEWIPTTIYSGDVDDNEKEDDDDDDDDEG